MTKPTAGDPDVQVTTVPDGVVCGRINQFLMLSLASDELTVQWCGIGDPTDWPTPNTDDARAVQAGAQTLSAEHGLVTAIAGNDFFGYIFQQRAITKATYVGGDIVFAFDTFEEGRGCFEYGRYTQVDDAVYFESEFGRHVLLDGSISDIGYGITDDSQAPAATLEQKTIAVNVGIKTVFFEDGNVAYNYKTGQWTAQPAFLGRHYYNIDSADGVIGQVVFSNSRIDLQTSSGGVAQTATIETGEADLNQGGRAFVSGTRPLINKSASTSVTVSIGERDDQSEAVTYHTLSSVNSRTGRHDGRVDGRYIRTRTVITGGFDTIWGEDVDVTPAGSV